MRKDHLEKAIRLADKSKARPESVVIGKPIKSKKKPTALVMSERLYTRLTPAEMKRLKVRIGKMIPFSELLR